MMPNNVKVIFFDFYGVIRADGLLKYLYKLGLTYSGEIRTADEARTAGQITREQYFDRLSAETGDSSEYILKFMEEAGVLDQEVLDVVARLRKNGYTATILSNCTAHTLEYIKKHRIDSYFDDMVLSYELGINKPDLRIYKLALEKLGITADQAIFIDDKAENTDDAEKIGIKSILFTSAADLLVELRKLGVKI
jgi:epoxide hydrolase-like predicted phosphatase